VAHGHFVAEHRADRPLCVADWEFDRDRSAILERFATQLYELLVEVLFEFVILGYAVDARLRSGEFRANQNW